MKSIEYVSQINQASLRAKTVIQTDILANIQILIYQVITYERLLFMEDGILFKSDMTVIWTLIYK